MNTKDKKRKGPGWGIFVLIISLLMLALAAAGLVFVILPHIRERQAGADEGRTESLSTNVVAVKAGNDEDKAQTAQNTGDDTQDSVSDDEARPTEELSKYPALMGKYNNIGDGGFVCVNEDGTGLFYADASAQELLYISEDDYSVVAEGYCRSLSAADSRIYYICDGRAYSCGEDGSASEAIEALADFDELTSLYVSDEYFFAYELKISADVGGRSSRIMAFSRESGARMGSVSLGYASGDEDYGTKQFIIADNGYLYYILRSDDGIYYDAQAMDHIWRLPAGDLYAEPESVIYALDERLHYRQLICEGNALYVLYENRDGNSAVTMYDMESDSILSDKYWAKEKYGFVSANVRDGVLYLSVIDYEEGQRAVWAIDSAGGDISWMGRELSAIEPGFETVSLAVDDTAEGACLFYTVNDGAGKLKLGYIALEDEEDEGYIID